MPIYEYICQDCGKQFETIVTSFAARDTITCKYCNSVKTKKTMSATSFRVASSAGSVPMGSGMSGGGCSSGSGFR